MDAHETEKPVRKLEYLMIATCQNHIPMKSHPRLRSSLLTSYIVILFFFIKPMLDKQSAICVQNSVSARGADSVLRKNWLLAVDCTSGVSFSK